MLSLAKFLKNAAAAQERDFSSVFLLLRVEQFVYNVESMNKSA
jgi:hypothetical protein